MQIQALQIETKLLGLSCGAVFVTFLMQILNVMVKYFEKGSYINLMLFLQTAHSNPALSVPLDLHIIYWLHAAIKFKVTFSEKNC